MSNTKKSIENLIEMALAQKPVEFGDIFNKIIKEKAKFYVDDLKEILRENMWKNDDEDKDENNDEDSDKESSENEVKKKIQASSSAGQNRSNAIHASIHRDDTTGQD